ncbi:hypothetical protein F2P81_005425 [Scophthalmus maximus]|uniref:Uncharacterized protein n=1 Tax=Scophthalmus maximus TaxID=52904 RepID=A0A6A4T782_SCOMX|nr:hypothetical protein F2P81_005425 [Scophthalmus maximus]
MQFAGEGRRAAHASLEDQSVIYEAFLYVQCFLPGDLGNNPQIGRGNVALIHHGEWRRRSGGKDQPKQRVFNSEEPESESDRNNEPITEMDCASD